MKRFIGILAGIGALTAAMTAAAWAQDATTASPSGNGSAYVDADGDGICDVAGQVHQFRARLGGGGAKGLGLKRAGVTLTAEQQATIEGVAAEYRKAHADQMTTLQARQAELSALMKAEAPDQAAIDAKVAEIATLRAQIQTEAVAHRAAVREVLTPEQQAAVAAAYTGKGVGKGFGMGKTQNRGSGRGRGQGTPAN